MVGNVSPHAYARELTSRDGSANLLREIKRVDHACLTHNVVPVYTLAHLCVIAKVPYEAARDVIFNHRAHYTSRKLVKRSGLGYRTIHEPTPQLKSLQRAILQNCLPKHVSSELSFAFETGRNTSQAARHHIGARAMIHVDIQDFFGSIGSRRVYSVFADLGYPELLALEMALITSVGHEVTLRGPDDRGVPYEFLKEGRLPQGASTSGKISNLLCKNLDNLLSEIAIKRGGVVTRYADDISFSWPSPMTRSEGGAILAEIGRAVSEAGFNVNPKKTRLIPKSNEFRMLGLCVGQKGIWLNRNYKSHIRAHLYGVEEFGLSEHAISRGFFSDLEFISFIWGHYAYSAYIDPSFASEVRSRLETAGVPDV
jgi:RNA-directed DNA polymerase